MRAFVRLRCPDDRLAELGHGDTIGRVSSAALCIDDPRVSEAHAMVSVRRGELVLLSLRRMFAVRGKPLTHVVLSAGMAIELAEGVCLEVEHVERPDHVLSIEADGLGRRSLPGVASLHLSPLHLSPRFEPDAALHVWWNGASWRARVLGSEPARAIDDGTELEIAGTRVRFVRVEIEGSITTPGAGAGLETPLRIVAWYDGVEVHRDGRPPLTLSGVGARILSELVMLDGPAEWHVIAGEVWPKDVEAKELRHRWDVNLNRLRTRLREAGIRADLLRSNGGYVQLVRYPSDVFEDRA